MTARVLSYLYVGVGLDIRPTFRVEIGQLFFLMGLLHGGSNSVGSI
jgi:hypothetical protein